MSQCKEIFEQMKAEVEVENIEYNKENQALQKLNRKVFKAVLITLTICALAVASFSISLYLMESELR